MSIEALQAVLNKHHFADEFEPRHFEKLRALAREVRFSPDQIIFREGDDTHDFYLIAQGRVGLEIVIPDGIVRVHTLTAGDELGWSAVLMGQGKYFQARALEAVEMYAFDGNRLIEACRQDTAFGYALMHRLLGVVASRLQSTRMQLIDSFSPVGKRAGA